MAFLNDNNFMVEMSEEELTEVNGTGGYGGYGDYGLGACGVCGAVALPVIAVPAIGACGTCGYGAFATGPYISAFTNQAANTFSYNTNYATTNSLQNSYFTLVN